MFVIKRVQIFKVEEGVKQTGEVGLRFLWSGMDFHDVVIMSNKCGDYYDFLDILIETRTTTCLYFHWLPCCRCLCMNSFFIFADYEYQVTRGAITTH